jgi:hypothetical protein
MAGNLTAMIASIFSGSAVTADPYYEYTTLLLPGNGTNGAQNNTFLDASTNNFTITRNGNTTQGTFSPFSQTGWGNYFDGDGDYFTATANAAYTLGTNDHTIECWFYLDGTQQSSSTIFAYASGSTNTSTNSYFFSVGNTSGNLLLGNGSGGWGVNISFTTPSKNTWHHLAIVRNGNVFTLYIDGVSTGTPATYSANIASQSSFPFEIGGQVTGTGTLGSTAFKGYISNFRVVNGTAVYTSAFTPPTSSLTAITNTVLLTCQSNRFIDNSSNNFTITRNGDTRVVAFSPFNPSASWSAATYGGSGYFDGSGDYLSVASNAAFGLGSGDFTIEAFLYPTTTGTDRAITDLRTVDNSNGTFFLNTSGLLSWYNGTSTIGATGTAVTLNAWNHVVLSRVSGTSRAFLNGIQQWSSASLGTLPASCPVGVGGASYSGGSAYTGYISSVRIVKGSGVTSVTVPTAPLTAITNTSLLLNFTNAGIYDATSKNDLETVGNAQISNTTAQFGSTSIKFDGTGDWLLIPDQPQQRIGTGNFTVEMWVYRNSSGTYGLAGKGTGTTGWLVSLNSSNQVVFTYGSSTITSSGTVSATTWTHIAVVREGTSTNQTKIYISGTNDGTGTVSTDFNQTNSMYIGADRTGGSAANAYVQDVRITNYARYTANFTAPTAAFPTL